jgi:acetyl-CoA acyltransferase
MKQVVIVDYLRTPFAKAVEPTSGSAKQGKFATCLPDDMVAALIAESLQRTGVNAHDIENLLLGCVHQEAEQGLNLARMIVLNPDSRLPQSVGGVTVDRFCGSSMHIIADAKNAIMAGEADVMLCAGVQSISRVPMAGWNPMLNPKVYEGNAKGFMNMGITAENLADRFQISRQAQEEFALMSHQKAAQAQDAGFFKTEILSFHGLDLDDSVRRDSSLEQLAKLKPAFKQEGTVTAGTSSPHTDGASLVLLAAEDYAQAHNLPILARVKSFAGSGCEPEIMGIGPVNAIQKALSRAGLSMRDIGVVELNEAFAVQTLAVLKALDQSGLTVEAHQLNIDGGAIALGHPLGASGARITGKVAQLLQRTGQKYGLASMCIGGGQGVAIVLENPLGKTP